MTVKGCKMKIYAWYLRPLRREGSLSCHTNLFHVASVFCGLIRRTYPILFPIRRYMAEILPTRRNTQPNQSMKWSPIAMSKGYLERILNQNPSGRQSLQSGSLSILLSLVFVHVRHA